VLERRAAQLTGNSATCPEVIIKSDPRGKKTKKHENIQTERDCFKP